MTAFNPDWAIAPWETIEELCLDRRYDEQTVRMQLQLTPEDWDALKRGDHRIDTALALRMEIVFGLSALFWQNLDRLYVERKEALS